MFRRARQLRPAAQHETDYDRERAEEADRETRDRSTDREEQDSEHRHPGADADDDLWSPAPVRFTDPADLFGEPVYARGAMTLHALRREIGTRDFLDLARRWAADFAYDNVRTRDLERLAEEVSGEQLDELFDDWLRRDGKPRGY